VLSILTAESSVGTTSSTLPDATSATLEGRAADDAVLVARDLPDVGSTAIEANISNSRVFDIGVAGESVGFHVRPFVFVFLTFW
jgi:hypothetical protein